MLKKIVLLALLGLPSTVAAMDEAQLQDVVNQHIETNKCEDESCMREQLTACLDAVKDAGRDMCYDATLKQSDIGVSKLYTELVEMAAEHDAKFGADSENGNTGSYLAKSQAAWLESRTNTCEYERRTKAYPKDRDNAFKYCQAIMNIYRFHELVDVMWEDHV